MVSRLRNEECWPRASGGCRAPRASKWGDGTVRSLAAPARAGIVVAFGVGLVLHLIHAGAHEAHAPSPVLHWLRDSALALPGTIAVLAIAFAPARALVRWAGLSADGRIGHLLQSLAGAVGYALFTIPAGSVHARLFAAEHHGSGFVTHALPAGSVAVLPSFALLPALPLLP